MTSDQIEDIWERYLQEGMPLSLKGVELLHPDLLLHPNLRLSGFLKLASMLKRPNYFPIHPAGDDLRLADFHLLKEDIKEEDVIYLFRCGIIPDVMSSCFIVPV